MATTVQNLIDGAMALLRVFPNDAAPSAAEYADGLTALNDLFDWLGNPESPIGVRKQAYTGTVAAAQTDAGYATSVLFGTALAQVDSLAVSSGSYRYPFEQIPLEQYDEIADKTSSLAAPFSGFFAVRRDISDTYIYMYPAPSVGVQIFVRASAAMPQFTATSDVVTMADSAAFPGFRLFLKYALARELAPQWQVSLDPEIEIRYRAMVKAFRKLTSDPHILRVDACLLGAGRSDIYSGL